VIARSPIRFVLIAVLLLSGGSARGQDLQSSIDKLKSSDDFRVRVQAALELGKSKNSEVRVPLEHALDDRKPAVRAAAAAALKVLSDKRALSALKRHQTDSSESVRAQIRASMEALSADSAEFENSSVAPSGPARLLVKLGSIRNGTAVKSGALVGRIERSSREKLGRLPGVRVVAESEDVNSAAKKKRLPAVMVTGRLARLNASREGEEIVYSASVDYVVHRMPEQSIVSTMSGSASAKASTLEARDERRMAELRSLVLEAAIDSAMKRAAVALEAEMR
jgi:hypothetical protein